LEKSSLRELRIMEEFSVPPGQDYVGEEGGCLNNILKSIRKEKNERIKQLKKEKKFIESERLRVRVENDLRSIREIGYCSGIENYSRYFDGRKEGETPYVLLDYLSKDFLIIVDESHITIPQIKAMYNTNLKRLDNLVEYGFRLPSSKDNRPLNIEEFFQKINSIIYVSATPGSFEIGRVEGEIVEQIIRPTGLVDPEIEIRNSEGQIRDIIKEIDIRAIKGEKVLIYALTISMSEEIADYLRNRGVKVVYLHSKMEVFERYQAITSLRRGIYDVIVGINLLKEGIDMPEVSLVCIIDADKSGFLRNFRSLIQIIGRAARNKNGRVIFYADSITEDMKSAIEETKRRREIQKNHNLKNSIIPKTIEKPIKDIVIDEEMSRRIEYATKGNLNEEEYEKLIKSLRKEMKSLAKQFKFDQAISLRNSIADLERKDYKFSRKILSRKKH
jgi:excinuclease ABC subunit B